MKTLLRISVCLNLALIGGVIFLLASRRKEAAVPAPAAFEKPSAPVAASPALSAAPTVEPAPFRWSQLDSTDDYRVYVMNLRAIGCPSQTIADIVRGNTSRAFEWRRNQLGLDGSGSGPWSRSEQTQLVANLLGERPLAAGTAGLAQSTKNPMGGNGAAEASAPEQSPADGASLGTRSGNEIALGSVPSASMRAATPSHPLFLENVNWSALGFDAGQQAAIAQVREQFLSQHNSQGQNPAGLANPNPSDPADPNSGSSTPLHPWQTASQSPDDTLPALLGAEGYTAYEQEQYLRWYTPQVLANVEGGNLTIDLNTFSLQ